jgi:trigger factor
LVLETDWQMQVTETLSDGLKRAYTVVLPATDIESRKTARLTDLGKTLQVPGFRPGKVPLPVVRQRYGTAVAAEVLEQSVNEAAQQVLTDRGLRPAMEPKLDLVTEDPIKNTGSDLEFRMEVELLPEITLPDFSGISLTRMKVEPEPGKVDEMLGAIAQRNRELVEIPEEELQGRGAEKGEVLTVDYLGKIDGTPFEGGASTGVDVDVAGSGFIAGFAEQLEGMKPGEARTIEVRFPDDYFNKDLAGKAATFDITAQRLRKAVVPAVDDALAEKLAYGDLAEMREAVEKAFRSETDALARLRLKRQLLDALAERADFAAPQGMVDREFGQIWARLEADRKGGQLDEEDKDKDEETLKSEYRAIAERRVRLGLLLGEIGRANGITVSADEMTRAMRAEAARYPAQAMQMMELYRKYPAAAEALRGPIFEDKIVDFVLELAQVTEKPVSLEELNQEPPTPTPGVSAGTSSPEPSPGASEAEASGA